MHRTCQGIRKQEKKHTFLDQKTTSKQDNLGIDWRIMGHITYIGYINVN
jgi:hypothetical protein